MSSTSGQSYQVFVQWYPNGYKKCEWYPNGQKIEYYENGQKKSETNFISSINIVQRDNQGKKIE
jgi:antitoxin component YwqK of YwqJK toxin-antitoxin module